MIVFADITLEKAISRERGFHRIVGMMRLAMMREKP
jgi:hypothetical protein